ncbi:MAG: hypothetical protein JSW33_10500 [bacterium]|nr:MAG: hypothetical protein JSW33_10500 [bacterium]
MANKTSELKTIWYFVGIILIIMGGLVFLSGIVQLVAPPLTKTILSELYPAIWWGGLMMIVGLIYFLTNKNKIVD